jgi:Tol biopolymer transport system component
LKKAVTLSLVFCAGCSTVKGWFTPGADDPRAGVPLTEFKAKDGDYFPPFVMKFFPSAADYMKQYPTLEQARSDLNLIEIKQLNPGDTRFNEANLSWSADGVYLGFEVITDGFRKIMLKDLAGNYARDLQMIPKGNDNFLDGMVVKSAQSYNAGLRWSRDSTRFAFMSNGGIGEYNIYVGAIGAKEKSITKSQTKDGYATWSPSTQEIAFVSGRSGNGDIYLVDLKSKDVTRLSSTDAVDIFPEWFPNANRLVYASGDALNHDLYLVERKDRQAKWEKPYALTSWSRDDLRPTVSPDGRYVAFYADAGEVNGGDGLRRWIILVVPY